MMIRQGANGHTCCAMACRAMHAPAALSPLGRHGTFHILLGGQQWITQEDSLKPAHTFESPNEGAQIMERSAAVGVLRRQGRTKLND